MKKIFGIVGLLFLLHTTLSAQLRHGVHLMAGIAKMQSSSVVIYSEPFVSEVIDNFDNSWTVGYEGGLALDNGFALQFGLDVLLLNAKRLESVYASDDDFANFDSALSATYLGVPFLIGFKIQNITLLTGPRASIFLSGAVESVRMGKESGIAFMSTDEGDLASLDRVDLGHHTEMNYGLGENLEVLISYYYGFGALASKPNAGNYYQQLSIGLAYLFK